MTQATARASATLRNFVNGKHTDPCEGAYSEVVDPSMPLGSIVPFA